MWARRDFLGYPFISSNLVAAGGNTGGVPAVQGNLTNNIGAAAAAGITGGSLQNNINDGVGGRLQRAVGGRRAVFSVPSAAATSASSACRRPSAP
jgi:hypothetical protein